MCDIRGVPIGCVQCQAQGQVSGPCPAVCLSSPHFLQISAPLSIQASNYGPTRPLLGPQTPGRFLLRPSAHHLSHPTPAFISTAAVVVLSGRQELWVLILSLPLTLCDLGQPPGPLSRDQCQFFINEKIITAPTGWPTVRIKQVNKRHMALTTCSEAFLLFSGVLCQYLRISPVSPQVAP